eukprot:GHVP01070344.1.p1 GENE.GHVP01070344.1~~GHVP01070344.1.p1  ORF type:complete len:167 (-),score=23.22 GHVP01070344.1:741-1241(-)
MAKIPKPNDISSQNILEEARRAYYAIPSPNARDHNSQPTKDITQQASPSQSRSRSHSPASRQLPHHKKYIAPEEKETHTQARQNTEASTRIPKPPTQLNYHHQHQAFDDSIPYVQPRHPAQQQHPPQPIYHHDDDYYPSRSQDTAYDDDPFSLIMPPRSSEDQFGV